MEDEAAAAAAMLSRLSARLMTENAVELPLQQLTSLRSQCDRFIAALDAAARREVAAPPQAPAKQSDPAATLGAGRMASRLRQQSETIHHSRLCERRQGSLRPCCSSNGSAAPVNFEERYEGDMAAAAQAFHELFNEESPPSCNNVWRRRPSGAGWSTVSEARAEAPDGHAEREESAPRPSKFASRMKGETETAANSRLCRRRAASCGTIRYGQRRSAVVSSAIQRPGINVD